MVFYIFPSPGKKLEVMISELSNEEPRLLVLTLNPASSAFESLASYSRGKWVVGTVKSVSSFGLFVRPSGTDVTGIESAAVKI